ncbi:putative AT hook motif-containing protein [Quillaja saponaria]|uniref:AT hook motif-containing protein n=1 Tax=Quillaja saponaria TaxID=32244 RepID=A0AAD7LTE7_QUISA|nr:putative AT hook motif-containing protein [Quillaja saponaria]
MNQGNQNSNPGGSADVPLKRKRGRPRKYPRPNFEQNARPRNQNLQNRQNAQVPPGFDRVNENENYERIPFDNANGFVIGQVVSCVIDGAFDAGYLLSVRAGHPNNVLRGVVFKPGHVVPITAENDVAPNIPMIPRYEVPFPTGTNGSFERNEQHVSMHKNVSYPLHGSPAVNQVRRSASSSSNLLASKGKQLHSSAQQSGHPVTRGNVVPIVLQPGKTSSEVPGSDQLSLVAIQASHALTMNGKAAQVANGSTATSDLPIVKDQTPRSQSQTSQMMLSKGIQNEKVYLHQLSAEALQEEEARSLKLPDLSIENLLTEVIERIKTPTQTPETKIDNSQSGGKPSVKNSCQGLENKANDMDLPPLVKPLQALQPNHAGISLSASRPLESD